MLALNPEYDTIQTSHKIFNQKLKSQFTKFLQQFYTPQQGKKYIKKIEQMIILQKSNTLLINRKDFQQYNSQLAFLIFNEFSRYQTILNDTLTELTIQIQKNLDPNQWKEENIEKIDIQDQNSLKKQDRYQVAFDLGLTSESLDESIRNLKCEMLGKLRSVVVTVTRVSQIRPQLLVGVFNCGYCGRKSQKILQQYKYTTPKKCLAIGCTNNSSWEINDKFSIFADFQKLRVQQDAAKIPPGSMPRSIDVVLRNGLIDKGQPGDKVHIVGYLAVIPDIQSLLKPGERTAVLTRNPNVRNESSQQGVKGIKGIKQLNYKLCFIANNIFVMNNQFDENILTEQDIDQLQPKNQDQYNDSKIKQKILGDMNESQVIQIKRIRENPRMFELLAESLFNEIFGHIEIKKALLLQLLGGVHKKTENKISLRGDINILIVGDPSTAKSQFLKCVNKFVPRSVYTNGKTTTAAGLTASVVRDQDNGNVSIEAGALLLADNGICCIDEFDKMEIKDQVAIHEAMQQQTISIAKAGVQATLHARTSILAAANPIFGRYDKAQSLRKNINISPPIMSRFDLYFIICDEVNEQMDTKLSNFIVSMHQKKVNEIKQKPFTIKQVRNYIAVAKRFKPRLTKQASELLRKYYVEIRKNDKQKQNSQYQVTVRQLESMIRLSQALAKLHLECQIKPQYVAEAYKLLSSSIIKLDKSAYQLVDQQSLSQDQKLSLGIKGLLQEQQAPQPKEVKKSKITVTHQVYEEIKGRIQQLFDEKQRRHKQEKIQDVQLYLSYEDIVAFLHATSFKYSQINSQYDIQKSKKFYYAIIGKLIKQNYLILFQQTPDISKRLVGIHPNAVLPEEVEKYQVDQIEEQL